MEIKNMNTFSGVRRAINYEACQIETLESEARFVQETRRWDDDAGIETMRSKEHAHDYRYFPELDTCRCAQAMSGWPRYVRTSSSCR